MAGVIWNLEEIISAGCVVLDIGPKHSQAEMQRIGCDAGIDVWDQQFTMRGWRVAADRWALCYLPVHAHLPR